MDTLSNRAQRLGSCTTKMMENFLVVQRNSYDDQSNPQGICNCGVAENYLCENELTTKLESIRVWQKQHIYYANPIGQLSLRENLCRTFERLFQLNHQLDPNRMIISSGLAGIMSLLGYLLADRSELFLIPAPYYTVFDHDLSVLSGCCTWPCPLLEQDTGKFSFSVDIFQRGYDDAVRQGRRPRALIIVNPQNPLGDVYDEDSMLPILKFAAEKQLHVIFDEIYALSMFDDQPTFPSALNYQSIVDPERTHFVWSFSKDFALSGLRLGVAYAGSSDLCSVAGSVNFLQIPSTIIQESLASLLSDHAWIESYIALNRSRLTKRYKQVVKQLNDLDSRIMVRPARAGFFIWIDCRCFLHEVTFNEEDRLFQVIFDNGVYISTGSSLGCSQPGWFRMIFSIREQWIDEALKRMKLALNIYASSKTSSVSLQERINEDST
jgi:aspartate/methionine/tyrosine aminotransferase